MRERAFRQCVSFRDNPTLSLRNCNYTRTYIKIYIYVTIKVTAQTCAAMRYIIGSNLAVLNCLTSFLCRERNILVENNYTD